MGIGLGAIEPSVRSIGLLFVAWCDSELFVFDGFGDEVVFFLAILLLAV